MSRRAAILGYGFVIASILLSRSLVAGTWKSVASVTPDPNEPLCKAFQRHLNGAGEKCFEISLQTFPGFASPPWQKLDPQEHLDLIARLIAYRSGRDLYLRNPIDLDRFRRGAKDFIEQGGELWMWRSRLLSHFGDNANLPAPPGDQTFVRLIYRPGIRSQDPACVKEASGIGIGPTFLVLPDLSGPDPRLEQGVAYALQTHQPMMYRNEGAFRRHLRARRGRGTGRRFQELRRDWAQRRSLHF